jgi:hypothetical protein
LFEPIRETRLRWKPLGGPEGGASAIGPLSQRECGIDTKPRQLARRRYLAMHKGEWVRNTRRQGGSGPIPSVYQ